MSRITRIITKKIKVGDDGSGGSFDLNDMFSQMIGPGNIDMDVAWTRYQKVRKLVSNVIMILKQFSESPFLKACGPSYYPSLGMARDEIKDFVTKSEGEIKRLFWFTYDSLKIGYDSRDGVFMMKNINIEVKRKFSEAYETIIKSDLIKALVITCNNLAEFKDHLAPGLKGGKKGKDNAKPSYDFVISMNSMFFEPFPFAKSLNLKEVFFPKDVTKAAKDYSLLVVNRILVLTYDIYREVSSPNIDVDAFAEVIKMNIAKIRKIPELHRCQSAFDKIEESIGTFKDNFHEYYQDFVSTQSPTIIFEHYIVDVSRQEGVSPEIMRQFQSIISYYRKMAQHRGGEDPRLKAMFASMGDNLSGFTGHTQNL